MQEIILASASPRRKQLLEQVGLEFSCMTADVDEEAFYNLHPGDLVKKLAWQKAQAVAGRTEQNIIIAADTVVVLDDVIMGKPLDREDARQKLTLLSGREHQVMTGICVVNQQNESHSTEFEVTKVWFRHLSNGEIQGYLDCGEWVDKAGGYGIQGLGALLIEKIDGCYFNVVGLPLSKLYQLLYKQGVYLLGGEAPNGVQGWN
ncbi:Maf-like protein [Syntrophomonas zehnderi OL-4]|uniref:dTTP/UTP pyrophosphatase n=1 Tax=Syntrophomonas zehnderi OL-4 TaxID=690567 RepID=A0A0E4GB71_9FIRM|nr:Maf family protein [Syntrophomonas zehnderi]CFX80919.1 Maf-like protein [Syntrophomonas zehnderi OL-4]